MEENKDSYQEFSFGENFSEFAVNSKRIQQRANLIRYIVYGALYAGHTMRHTMLCIMYTVYAVNAIH